MAQLSFLAASPSDVDCSALEIPELIQIVIGRPTNVHTMLAESGGLYELSRLTVQELDDLTGVDADTATRIAAALELGRRAVGAEKRQGKQIRGPDDVGNLLMDEMGLLEHEEMRVVLVDTKNFVQKVVTVYKGSLNTAVVRIGELFRDAVRGQAAAVVLVHNHPSGDPMPSPEDVKVTQMVVEAGKLLDIDVLDHIVIGKGRFVSMKERGLGF